MKGSGLMRTLLTTMLVVAAVLPASVLAGGTSGRSTAAVAVIGDGGALGIGSDLKHPFQPAPVNSWATGTTPAVKSVYLRLAAVSPAVKGHETNLAHEGTTLAQLTGQVRRAIALDPKPDLVLVQAGSDDVKCDGQDASHYTAFRADFAAALGQLSRGLPKARIFVLSDWGSVRSYVKAMVGLDSGARLTHAGRGPCSLFAPSSSASPGSVVPAHVAYLERTLKAYDAQRAAACAQYPRCTFDGGAASRMVVTAADLSPRYDSLSLAGNSKLAAIEWAAMRRLHVVQG